MCKKYSLKQRIFASSIHFSISLKLFLEGHLSLMHLDTKKLFVIIMPAMKAAQCSTISNLQLEVKTLITT